MKKGDPVRYSQLGLTCLYSSEKIRIKAATYVGQVTCEPKNEIWVSVRWNGRKRAMIIAKKYVEKMQIN
jgi:hypothetical protein